METHTQIHQGEHKVILMLLTTAKKKNRNSADTVKSKTGLADCSVFVQWTARQKFPSEEWHCQDQELMAKSMSKKQNTNGP